MVADVKLNQYFTLSDEIIKNLDINEGDTFEVIEHEGKLMLCPVVVYPEEYIEELKKISKEHMKGPRVAYDSVDDMFKAMGIDLEDDSDV